MNGNYTNNGQVGAMGDHATASNFTFGAQVKDSFTLTKDNLEDLNKLTESLMTYTGKEVKKSEIINASMLVQELSESIEDDNTNNQSKAIGKWRSFLSNVGPNVVDTIKLLSAGIGLADEVKTLLGL